MQLSIFNLGCEKPYKIKKPIRLIELFGGIGSQAKALENLKANFTHYRLCEFDKFAVTSYNAIHKTSFLPSDITKLSAKDLGIVETDKYEYIMTYSFPCQDLSIAGKQAGMEKGSGTRSGLLWEVERLLKECKELPQVLLMENVPQVLNGDFGGWLEFLESKGYHNYYKCLNAKNYGIPQNRDRCFMVSVLGNYYYDFPKEIPLKLRLKDMLESKVDEKYFISEKLLTYFCDMKNRNGYIRGLRFNPHDKDKSKYAWTITTNTGNRPTDNFVIEPIIIDDIYKNREPREYGDTAPTLRTNCQGLKVIEPKTNERFFRQAIETANKNSADNQIANTLTCNVENMDVCVPGEINVVGNYSPSGHEASRIVHPEGVAPTIKENHGTVTATVEPNYRIRKLTPKECWRLMGFSDKDFYAAQSAGVSNSQLYKQAGNSIVVNVLEEIFKKLF